MTVYIVSTRDEDERSSEWEVDSVWDTREGAQSRSNSLRIYYTVQVQAFPVLLEKV